MSTDRVVPRPMLTPYYCVVWGRTRVLEWGLFATRIEAQSRIDEHCQMAPKLRPDSGDDAAVDLAVDSAVPARFWVYSDRTVGIGIGGTALERSKEQLEQFVEFLAGVRPLLDREAV